MPAAFFVVRATVSDPGKRQAFDAWYSREHLPDAVKSFGAVKAWRYWSLTEPSLHHAMYQFADQANIFLCITDRNAIGSVVLQNGGLCTSRLRRDRCADHFHDILRIRVR